MSDEVEPSTVVGWLECGSSWPGEDRSKHRSRKSFGLSCGS